jgi:hypothetical protein
MNTRLDGPHYMGAPTVEIARLFLEYLECAPVILGGIGFNEQVRAQSERCAWLIEWARNIIALRSERAALPSEEQVKDWATLIDGLIHDGGVGAPLTAKERENLESLLSAVGQFATLQEEVRTLRESFKMDTLIGLRSRLQESEARADEMEAERTLWARRLADVRGEADSRLAEVQALLEDIFATVTSSPKASIGSIHNVYTPQVDVAQVERWKGRAALVKEASP